MPVERVHRSLGIGFVEKLYVSESHFPPAPLITSHVDTAEAVVGVTLAPLNLRQASESAEEVANSAYRHVQGKLADDHVFA